MPLAPARDSGEAATSRPVVQPPQRTAACQPALTRRFPLPTTRVHQPQPWLLSVQGGSPLFCATSLVLPPFSSSPWTRAATVAPSSLLSASPPRAALPRWQTSYNSLPPRWRACWGGAWCWPLCAARGRESVATCCTGRAWPSVRLTSRWMQSRAASTAWCRHYKWWPRPRAHARGPGTTAALMPRWSTAALPLVLNRRRRRGLVSQRHQPPSVLRHQRRLHVSLKPHQRRLHLPPRQRRLHNPALKHHLLGPPLSRRSAVCLLSRHLLFRGAPAVARSAEEVKVAPRRWLFDRLFLAHGLPRREARFPCSYRG